MKKLSSKQPIVKNGNICTHFMLNYLDDLIGGVNEGELITIAARSGQGKSTLARNLIRSFNYRSLSTLLVSTEETEGEISRKLEKINRLPLGNEYIFLENEIFTIEQIEKDIRRSGAKFVIIDYIQQLDGNIRENTKALKQLAIKHNCVIFILSQLNRGAHNRLPEVSMLSKSDNILHDSDQVGLMMMTDILDTDGDTLMLIDVAKNRKGNSGKIGLSLNKESGCLIDMPPEYFENCNKGLANSLAKKHPAGVDDILDQLGNIYQPKEEKPGMVLKNGIII